MASPREASNLTASSANTARSDQSLFTNQVLDSLVTNLWSSSPYETHVTEPVLTEAAGHTTALLDNLSITFVPSLGESATTFKYVYSSISPTATTSNMFTDNWTSVNSTTVTSSSISLSTTSMWTDDLVNNTQSWPSNSTTFAPTISTTNASENFSSLSTSDSSDPFQYSIPSTIDSSHEQTSSVQFLNTSISHLVTTNSPSPVMITSTSYVTEVRSTSSVTDVTSTFDPFRDEKLQLNRKIEDLNGTVHNLTAALVVVAAILFLVVAIFIIYKTCRYWRSRHTPTALPLDGLDNKPLKRDQKSYFRPQSTYDLTDKEEVRYQSSYSNSSSSDKQDELVTFPTAGRVTSGPVGGWERGSTNIPLKDTAGYDNAGFDLDESPGRTRITSGHRNNYKGGDSSFVDVQLT